MKTIRTTLFTTMLVALVSLCGASTGLAQFSTSDSSTRELIRRIQTRTDTLQQSVQNASDRGNYRVDELSRLINDFEAATNQLDRRLTNRRGSGNASSDAQTVLQRGAAIDTFMNDNRVGFGAQREWRTIKSDLDQLATIYNISPQWTSTTGTASDSRPTYNLSDLQMRQLIQRIETQTTNFSRTLRQDLTRGSRNNNYNQVSQQLSGFESALTQLRNRFNTRMVTSLEVNNLLQPASYLNGFIGDRQVSYQTRNSWNSLRPDLERLASAFNLSWNWNNVPGGTYPGGYGSAGDLTGTYSLNTGQGDNVRGAVDAATRSLSLAERQRVYDSLIRRLDPPSMLALAVDRRSNSVTIASTRAPQINFVADGREQTESARNGRTIKVRASLTNNSLSIVRDGDRANDFSVTFENSGRQLLVTRTLYNERLTQPVTVRSYYDRTSDSAQLNLYDTNRDESANNTASGTFVVPANTSLVAVLNSDLSTQTAQENDRFTMTVRSPGQYEGATIEGYVASVNRSGRVTGRSEMTLDFDTIRLRDGRTYRFAGILESVRTSSGEVVKIDNEGAVRESDQTNKTVTRTAIGTAVGALIGAIAGGGKGAAIGAAIGAGAGAGSVYVQGRNDLDLTSGTEITVRATGPRG